MATARNKLTESDKKFKAAKDKWKSERPKGKAWYRNEYAAGFALLSPEVKKAEARHEADMKAWKAREPKRDNSTSITKPTKPKVEEKSTAPKPTTPKTGESTRQSTTPTTKEESKINNDLKSVNQRGVASFIRSLLPSKDRLSPSQRFEKRKGRKENYGERKRRRG